MITGKFNTGVKYSPEGQFIEYSAVVIDSGLTLEVEIIFHDLTRLVSGKINTFVFANCKRDIELALMDSYNFGHYTEV